MVNRMHTKADTNNFFNKKVFKPIKGGGQAPKHSLQNEQNEIVRRRESNVSGAMDFSSFVAQSNGNTRTAPRKDPATPNNIHRRSSGEEGNYETNLNLEEKSSQRLQVLHQTTGKHARGAGEYSTVRGANSSKGSFGFFQ